MNARLLFLIALILLSACRTAASRRVEFLPTASFSSTMKSVHEAALLTLREQRLAVDLVEEDRIITREFQQKRYAWKLVTHLYAGEKTVTVDSHIEYHVLGGPTDVTGGLFQHYALMDLEDRLDAGRISHTEYLSERNTIENTPRQQPGMILKLDEAIHRSQKFLDQLAERLKPQK